MKKIIAFILMIVAMVCIFALSVSAAEFGEVETIDGMKEKDKLDTTSRVVLFDGTDYHTYPAYYIFKNETSSGLDFTQLNSLSGVTYSATSVVMVEYPEGITKAGSFVGATSLEYVKIPDSVITVRGTAFKNCTKLTTVVFSDKGNLTSFADQIFNGCTALESITLPEGLQTVTANVFNGCTNLKTVILPNSLTHIGENMFVNCTSLEAISIPSNVTNIGRNGFKGCSVLKSIVIPSGVTSIGNSAFQGCGALTSVNFPSSLTSIGESCFDSCTSLKIDVVLPEGITVIPKRAFFQSAITSISIPANATTIGYQSFYKCSNLNTDIVIPEGVTEIAYKAFSESPIKSVVVPSTVTTMGTEVFLSCTSLKTADIKCETISSNAFASCTALETVTLSNTKVIEGRAFTKCTKLSSINLPEGLTTINTCAFFQSTSLKSVVVPSTVTVIEEKAFENSGVTTAVVKSSVVGNRMFYNAPLTSVTLENTVTIGSDAFYQCDFAEIVLPETVTSVGASAFSGCSALESITVPGSVESFGTNVFTNCKNLTTVNYTGTNAELVKAAMPNDSVEIVEANHCDTYNGGEHTVSGENAINFVSFFEEITVTNDCSACGTKGIVIETIAPLFTWKGYSRSEFKDANGNYAVMQCFGVNKEAIEAYERVKGTEISFGVLATVNKAEEGQEIEAIKPKPNDEGVLSHNFDNLTHDYFEIKIIGIDGDNIDTKIVFCAYVIENGKMSYLNNNETVEELTGESYNDVVAIKNAE